MSREPSFYGQRAETEKKQTSGKHSGPDRRKEIRRSLQDRREEVRFELDKEDRRKDSGRRDDDHIPNYW